MAKRIKTPPTPPAPFVADSGDNWQIVRIPEFHDYEVTVDGQFIGSRPTLDEARALRNEYTFEMLENGLINETSEPQEITFDPKHNDYRIEVRGEFVGYASTLAMAEMTRAGYYQRMVNWGYFDAADLPADILSGLSARGTVVGVVVA